VAERCFRRRRRVSRPPRAVAHPRQGRDAYHPTAISPFPGASTGSGGEIRDEGATGRGAKPKAGLVGFTVSDLRLPGAREPWEAPEERWIGSPSRIATALDIMTEGPLGGAAFNNEFGRPAVLGYFRTFELPERTDGGDRVARGYHKPVMLAGGIGAIRPGHVAKAPIPEGAALIVLGGPAFLIGLGGGAASSLAQGASGRGSRLRIGPARQPEIQRRCQEVIDRCWAMGDVNPILSIHDVGAGGLSNALPELVHGSRLGAHLELRAIPTPGEPGPVAARAVVQRGAGALRSLAIAPDRSTRSRRCVRASARRGRGRDRERGRPPRADRTRARRHSARSMSARARARQAPRMVPPAPSGRAAADRTRPRHRERRRRARPLCSACRPSPTRASS